VKETNQHITKLLASHGIDVSRYDETFLSKSFQKRMAETHSLSDLEFGTYIDRNVDEVETIINSLNISYTEFFRNSLTFSVLERLLLPLIVSQKNSSKRKEIRIWSAACAAGQEVYSLAMLIEELRNRDYEKLNYRIFATDHNPSQIKLAEKGIYPLEALSNLSIKRVNHWFNKHGDSYNVKPELKANISFSEFDLFSMELSSPSASIFGDFNLVICANLLFYYKPEYRKIILQKVDNSLATGGYIIVGEAEREILMNYGYNEVFLQSGIFKKTE
jgi:chemotaxis protein methyltransferase CheR